MICQDFLAENPSALFNRHRKAKANYPPLNTAGAIYRIETCRWVPLAHGRFITLVCYLIDLLFN